MVNIFIYTLKKPCKYRKVTKSPNKARFYSWIMVNQDIKQLVYKQQL